VRRQGTTPAAARRGKPPASRSKYACTVQVLLNAEWIGRVNLDGSIAGPRRRERTDIIAMLTAIAQDRQTAATNLRRSLTLTDEGG
jgi:hypothetical protein